MCGGGGWEGGFGSSLPLLPWPPATPHASIFALTPTWGTERGVCLTRGHHPFLSSRSNGTPLCFLHTCPHVIMPGAALLLVLGARYLVLVFCRQLHGRNLLRGVARRL